LVQSNGLEILPHYVAINLYRTKQLKSSSDISIEYHTYTEKIPKSKHSAGNFGFIVVEPVIAHSSPFVVIVDFQPPCCRISRGADKSSRYCLYTTTLAITEEYDAIHSFIFVYLTTKERNLFYAINKRCA